MTFPRAFRSLNHRDYRLFFSAQLIALVTSWMQTVAQAWLVLQLTDSPLKLGLIGTLQFGPVLLFSLVSGAVADRLPKRRVLVGTEIAIAVQALSLAALVAAGAVQYWHVCLLALLAGFTNALDFPTRQSFVVELVGRDDVANAVALNSASFNGARIIGPAMAGLLIASVGVAPVFAINSAGALVKVGALLRLRAQGLPHPRTRTGMLADIAEGLAYARQTPLIIALLAVLSVVSLSVFNFTVYIPLLARHVFHLGAEGFGFLMAAVGVGAVAGALTVGTVARRDPPMTMIFAAAALACSGLLALSFVRHVWVAVPVLFLTGFSGIVLAASCNTSLQLAAPDDLRGRVMSLYTFVFGGAFPIGSFLVGAISERWGVSRALFIAGTGGLLVLAGVVTWWRRVATGVAAAAARVDQERAPDYAARRRRTTMTPALQHRYADVNGVHLHYVEAGQGRVVLFLHGFPEFWYEWKAQLADLAADHRVVAPDMRGYNLSSKPSAVEDYAMAHLVEDVRALVAQLGADRPVLVGHDWGGAVAWAVAIAHPRLLHKLVIVNAPHPAIFARELRENPAQQRASEYMLAFRSAKAEAILSADDHAVLVQRVLGPLLAGRHLSDADLKMYQEAWSQPGALTGGLNYYRAARVGPPSRDGMPASGTLGFEQGDRIVRVPTLVIWGEQDEALLTGNLDGLDQFVPDLTIQRIPDGSHWVIHEQPALVTRLIREFIA